MNREEVFNAYVALMEKRLQHFEAHSPAEAAPFREQLNALKQAGALHLGDFAQPLLDGVPPSSDTPVGSCTFTRTAPNVATFCLNNLTKDESDSLNGNFNEGGSCPVNLHWVPGPLTLEAAFRVYVAVQEERLQHFEATHAPEEAAPFRARLNALKAAGPLQLRDFAQPLMDEIPPAPGAPPGSCTYPLSGETFCLNNLTRDQCDALNGQFDENVACPVEIHWDSLRGGNPDTN